MNGRHIVQRDFPGLFDFLPRTGLNEIAMGKDYAFKVPL